VFDLSKHKPDKVLSRMWDNFHAAEVAGDHAARTYQSRLRILVAGGDGTIAW
jgi:diacylglycerol kinase (ATP)